jgi:hypothetical protein
VLGRGQHRAPALVALEPSRRERGGGGGQGRGLQEKQASPQSGGHASALGMGSGTARTAGGSRWVAKARQGFKGATESLCSMLAPPTQHAAPRSA